MNKEQELRAAAEDLLYWFECAEHADGRVDPKGGFDMTAIHALIDHLIADREAHGRAAWEVARKVKIDMGSVYEWDEYDDWAKSKQRERK